MMKTPILLALLLLAGCATQEPRVETQTVKVAVPVACQEPVPARPAMPTEKLKPGVTLDQYVAASQAEIELREGYEIRLYTALDNCRK